MATAVARAVPPAGLPAELPTAMPAMRSAPCWELFAHGADVGVRGWGCTQAQAFEQAARALTAVLTDPAAVRAQRSLTLTCRAPDDELLLLAWLNRLVTEMSLRGMLFSGFRVMLSQGTLRARVTGERINQARHRPAVEVKGATATELCVLQRPDGLWLAQAVVDV